MVIACGQCRTANPAAARFCMGCGAGLTQAAAPSGLRFVTVAFCDISGSTQMALRFDPQVWHGILEAYFAEVGGALVAAGGRLEKFIGDAVVGVFGADRAGEDDAINAVRGALNGLDALAARNDETISRYGVRLSIRFGIASGRVVTADRDSSFAIGSVMNRAARLQSAAPPDGTVVDVRSWLLVRDQVACRPVIPVPAKGFDKPLQAWSVSREALPREAEPVFVNQNDLLTRLDAAITSAAASPGVTRIGVVGAMGTGKTRVLQRLSAQARSRGMRTLLVSCPSNDEGLWRLQQIDRELGTHNDGGPAVAASTQELQWRIRRRMAEISVQRSLVVFIDDYHRSPDALRRLVELPPAGQVVFVLSGREVPAESDLLLEIPSLTADHSHELLSALHGDVELHSVTALESLVRRSRGNPLFLEQLAAMAGDGIDDEVAPSAEAALGARIDRLSVPTRHVLACLGAWGGDLRPGDLDAVCDLDEATLSASLGELESVGMAGNQTAAEVAYEHLVLGERGRVHSAIARRLQEYARTEPALLDLAVTHATRAHQHWRELDPGSAHDADATRLAAHCLVAAARQSIGRSEVRSAATLAGQARALLVPDEALVLEIASLESYALGASGQTAEALSRIDDVAALEGNPSARLHLEVNRAAFGTADFAQVRALAEVTEDPCAMARLDTWEGLYAARAGDYPRAEALLRAAHAGMSRFDAGLGIAEIYGNLSLFLVYGDTPVRAATAECLALRDEVAHAPILHAVVSCSAAVLLQRGGQRAEAITMVRQARSVFAEMGHMVGLAGSHEFGSVVAELSGDAAEACAEILTAYEVYQEAGATASAARCQLRAFVLDPERTLPDVSALNGVAGWELRVLQCQAAALRAGERDEALAYLDQAIEQISVIKGSGATLIPLSGCLRIARRLGDEPRIRSVRDTLLLTAPLWT